MSKGFLFAIDKDTEEVIVSNSTKGSNKVNLVTRVKKQECTALYHAVQTLAAVAAASPFDATIFKAMDKVCQLIYTNYNNVN